MFICTQYDCHIDSRLGFTLFHWTIRVRKLFQWSWWPQAELNLNWLIHDFGFQQITPAGALLSRYFRLIRLFQNKRWNKRICIIIHLLESVSELAEINLEINQQHIPSINFQRYFEHWDESHFPRLHLAIIAKFKSFLFWSA
jgi:hypothetical protein